MAKTTLRPLTMEDLDNMMTWINDKEVIGNFGYFKHPISREDEEQFLKKILNSENDIIYAIETEDGEYLGNAALNQIHWPSRNARLSLIIGNKKHHNKGYGTGAVLAILKKAFNEHNLHKVWLMVRESNEKAKHIYKKCGFKEEGIMREEYLLNGKYENMIRMSILKSEFTKKV